jgi:hypothetical protein
VAEEVVVPGEVATPLAAPLAKGPLGRVSPLRTTKTMISPTTAGNMEGGAIRTGVD